MKPALFSSVLPAVLLAMQAQAQSTVRGRVLGIDNSAVTGAVVVLEDSQTNARWQLLTDTTGRFFFRLPAGTPLRRYYFSASMLGYRDIRRHPVEVPQNHNVIATVYMGADPIPVAPIRVLERNMKRRFMSEYFDRADRVKKTGIGHVLMREDLEKWEGRSLPSLLAATTPGVRYVNTQSGAIVRMRPDVGDPGGCLPQIFLDNVPVAAEMFDMIQAEDLEGVEIYNGQGQMPPQYWRGTETCGVIVAWSKFPEQRKPADRDRFSFPAFVVGAITIYLMVTR